MKTWRRAGDRGAFHGRRSLAGFMTGVMVGFKAA
jgi:hypothetical protein